MRRALLGSIAMHGVAAAVLLALAVDHPPPPPRPSPPIAVELIAPRAPASSPATRAGGIAPAPAHATTPRTRVAQRVAGRRASPASPASPTSVRELVAGTIVEGVDSGGGMHGRGGAGGGTGRGIGVGDGEGIAPMTELPPPPPPPAAARVSKARPARLIYPANRRDADEDELFLARVTVDRDGYVAGARIVRGVGGPRQDQASQLIFRFRYEPALDDDGRPIVSTVEQPFLVGR